MKLSFVNQHLSIKKFESFELEKFSVITGLNGSGKTHLLQAINSGGIKVEGIEQNEIIYFNYNKFIVEPTYSHSSHSQILDGAYSSRRSYYQEYSNKANKVFGELQNQADIYEQGFLYFFREEGITLNSSSLFGEEKDWIGFVGKEINSDTILSIKGKVSPSLYNYLNHLTHNKKDVSIINEEFINDTIDKVKEKINTTFNKLYPEYLHVLLKNVAIVDVLRLEEHHFEGVGLTAKEFHDEIRTYLFKQADFLNRKSLSEFQGKDTSGFTLETFVKTHGENPLDYFNEVLELYDCNGYRFTTDDYFPSHGIAAESTTIPLNLKHKETGVKVQISTLSSGEQTLLSLAMIVYKAKRKGVLPRLLLLDEVDTALHPSMVKNLLSVIENVFVKEKGLNVILATHSPTTVALVPEESVFVLEREGGNVKVKSNTKQKAIEFLTEGFATLESSLGLLNYITKNKVSIFSEGKNVEYLKKANELFGSEEIEIISGVEAMTGKTQLGILFNFFKAVNHQNRVYFIWDCDVDTNYKDGNNTIPIILEKREETPIKKGIENMFPSELVSKEFYDIKVDDMGAKHENFNKNRFMNYVLEKGTDDDFINFKPIFDRIKKESNL